MPLAPRLDALTFLRFVAAAMIVVHHSVDTFSLPPQIAKMNLALAVSFFFVLSGFILSYVYGKISSLAEFVHFWQARIARCWPVHVMCLLLFAFVIKFGLGYDSDGNPCLPNFVANLFLLQAWVPRPDYFFSFNAPSWSVSVEFFFYLCFPFLQAWRIKGATVFKSVVLAVLVAAVSIACAHVAESSQSANHRLWLTDINPVSRLFEFVFGMLCATIFFRCHSLNTTIKASVIQIITLMALVVLWFCSSHLGNLLPAQALFGLLCGALIIALSLDQGVFSKWLSNRVAVALGDISYGIYMLHSPLSHAFRPFWESLAASHGYLSFALYTVILLVISFLVHVYFEKPMRTWLVKKKIHTAN